MRVQLTYQLSLLSYLSFCDIHNNDDVDNAHGEMESNHISFTSSDSAVLTEIKLLRDYFIVNEVSRFSSWYT